MIHFERIKNVLKIPEDFRFGMICINCDTDYCYNIVINTLNLYKLNYTCVIPDFEAFKVQLNIVREYCFIIIKKATTIDYKFDYCYTFETTMGKIKCTDISNLNRFLVGPNNLFFKVKKINDEHQILEI